MISKNAVFQNTDNSELYRLNSIANYTGSILSLDIKKNCFLQDTVLSLSRQVNKVLLYQIRLLDKSFLYCTIDTKFLTQNNTWKELKELKVYDIIQTITNQDNSILEIKEQFEDYAYKLVTNSGNSYLNNILVNTEK